MFLFLPPGPEIHLAMLACARLGVLFSTLYATLNYDELEFRFRDARPRAVLTHPDLLERLAPEITGSVEFFFLSQGPAPEGKWAMDLADDRPETHEPAWVDPDTPLYLLYTSGSTGPPKGVVHAHRDMVGHRVTAAYALDLSADSVLWTDGETAWVTGTVYGAFAPWLCRCASVVQDDPFAASTWYRTLERHRVSVWYTTPMTVRRLAAAGEDLPRRYDVSALRHISTVGETLSPEAFFWVKENFGLVPHDTWWMTETGMIMLANFPSTPTKPGSMGRPLPGVEAAVIDVLGRPEPELTLGELAVKAPWPAMMIGIFGDEERFQSYFRTGEWFATGDMVVRDEEGYFFHQGRNDDLIKVGDKLLGPYEIENVLHRHPAVREAGAIAMARGPGRVEVKAFVSLNPGYTPSARLNHEILTFVKTDLSAEVPLREVKFVATLPKTRSGKLLRRVLRAGELGLPSGDTSRLEEDAGEG